tara:strand:+ start:811 stop:1314 length:504 start_codon:yes stop_codon:yes gene_type:complete
MNKERDFKIVSCVRYGKSYASIGRDTGISGTRVTDIYRKHVRRASLHAGFNIYDQSIKIELSDKHIKEYFDTILSQPLTVKDRELYGLGSRIRLMLERNGLTSKSDVLSGIKSGAIYTYFCEGYGHQSHKRACAFVGIDYTRKTDKKSELQHVKYLEARGYKVTKPL